jgi:acyl dehydratase
MAVTATYRVGDEIPSLTKSLSQQGINLFEKSGGTEGPSQFTDEETARSTLGTSGTVASGRMSVTFGAEMLRRYFGPKQYNRGGMVELRFLRPARPGDTVTFTGKITAIDRTVDGARVFIGVTATNQKGDVTAVGTGSCIVPSLCLPAEE